MHTEQIQGSPKNIWTEISKAVEILSMCRSYTLTYRIPDEQWGQYVTILHTALSKAEDIPASARAVIEALLDVCPHGEESQKKCQKCWDKSMEWL